MAVLMGIEKFRPYIDGVEVKVVTDHASLRWLQQFVGDNQILYKSGMKACAIADLKVHIHTSRSAIAHAFIFVVNYR